jgi:hypothetical protein
VGQQQCDGQTGVVRNQPTGGGGGIQIMLYQHAFVSCAKLHHQFFLFVMGKKRNIHMDNSFLRKRL